MHFRVLPQSSATEKDLFADGAGDARGESLIIYLSFCSLRCEREICN